MVELGHDVTVLTAWHRGLRHSEFTAGMNVRRVWSGRRRRDRANIAEMIGFMVMAAPAAILIALRNRPDRVVAFFGLPSGPIAWLLYALFRIPYAVSLRGGDVPGFLPQQLRRAHQVSGFLLRMVWRRAAAIIANGSGLRTLARAYAPGLEIAAVPNGVDTTVFAPAVPPKAPGEVTRILFVGRLVTEQKGLDVLLTGLSRVPGTWELELVGDGPDRERIARHAQQLGCAERVRMRGWVERAALSSLYRAADIFVFPSRHEGVPNALLEAMASGLAVVASDIPSIREVISDGECGILVPTDDAGALAHAVTRLMTSPNTAAQLGAAARRRMEQDFGWRAVAAQYLRLCGIPG